MFTDKDTLRKYFPHLAKELEDELLMLSITNKNVNNVLKFKGYEPNVIDFIRRCDTEDQALEIINFMTKQNLISDGEAEKLKFILREKGIRYFGSKKEPGWYFKQASRY
ncbi:MAG: DUF2095 family protein [Candidatus Methanomethylicia archaeon]